MRFQQTLCSLSVLAFLVVSMTACSREEHVYSGNETAKLSPESIKLLEGEALNGSLQATQGLTQHYRYGKPQPFEVEKWLRQAILNGDPDAQVSLGALLSTAQNFYPVTKESCAIGIKYLEDAKRGGSRAAAEMLGSLSPICTKPWLNPYAKQ